MNTPHEQRVSIGQPRAEIREPRTRAPRLKTALFVFIIVISNSVGNVLLGEAMLKLPLFSPTFSYFISLVTNLWLIGGTVLMVIFTMAQLSLFSWADLTFVLPVTASGYIVTDLLSRFFLGEPISLARWIGIVILSVGVLLVAETPPHEQPGNHR